MLIFYCATHLYLFAGLLFPIGVAAQQDPPPPAAPAESSKSPVRPSPKTGTSPSAALFRKHCGKCHGTDGTGSPSREGQPEIPDFTKSSWQAGRSDTELVASILEGKGKEMPPWRGKIGEEQARGLAKHIRGFAPVKDRPKPKPEAKGFEEEFRRLQKELDKLQRQFREFPTASGGVPSKPSEVLHGCSTTTSFASLRFQVEPVQKPVHHRRQDDACGEDERQAAVECVTAGEQLAAPRLQGTERAHARENHGCVRKRIDPFHAFQ
jgi:mono/diheme cytochrome c family protein